MQLIYQKEIPRGMYWFINFNDFKKPRGKSIKELNLVFEGNGTELANITLEMLFNINCLLFDSNIDRRKKSGWTFFSVGINNQPIKLICKSYIKIYEV